MQRSPGRFNTRAFIAIGLALCAAGLVVSGVANHLRGFESITSARHAWMAAHNALAVLFVILCVWHAVLNGPALLRHLRGGASRSALPSREAALAFLLVVGITALLAGHALLAGGRGPDGGPRQGAHGGPRGAR